MGGVSDGRGIMRAALRIEGMTSAHDAEQIRRKVGSLEGVQGIDADVSSGRVQIAYDPSGVSVQDIMRSVSGTGMGCYLLKERGLRGTWWKERQQLALYTSGGITLFSFILMFLGAQEIVTNALFGVAVVVGVYYPARKAIIALINLVATIHLLMLIGAAGAVLLGMWYEAAS